MSIKNVIYFRVERVSNNDLRPPCSPVYYPKIEFLGALNL
jgi:hypothetical protein